MLSVEPRPRRSHVATFGMSVDAAFHGRGVGSALMREMINLCDNWLRVERIELTVFADNAAAVAVYRKHGFVVEGTGGSLPCATASMWMRIYGANEVTAKYGPVAPRQPGP
jgi:RimJ/RimL family protein N-acetyltransferase